MLVFRTLNDSGSRAEHICVCVDSLACVFSGWPGLAWPGLAWQGLPGMTPQAPLASHRLSKNRTAFIFKLKQKSLRSMKLSVGSMK